MARPGMCVERRVGARVIALFAVVFTTTLLALVPRDGRTENALLPEPTAAARYISAYAHRDETLAEEVASPLYRAEWARRSVSVADRVRWMPTEAEDGTPLDEWLRFTYLGGVMDGHGVGHLLYAAEASDTAKGPTPSIWRVDTDADGRVIWSEMVWLFSESTQGWTPLTGAGAVAGAPVPEELGRLGARPILGVRSNETAEAYYLAGIPAQEDAEAPTPTAVAFYAVDAEGEFRPSAWTYGMAAFGARKRLPAPTPVQEPAAS